MQERPSVSLLLKQEWPNCARLKNVKFFSILMDGTTDVGKIDDELFLVQWCDVDGTDEKIYSRMEYFTVSRPKSGNAKGLFKCLQSVLQEFGVAALNVENCKMLVGIETDGTSVNTAAAGLKGLVEGELQLVFWMWCLAHRQELALKDALKGTVFDLIDEMLVCLYYVYKKSPKNAVCWRKLLLICGSVLNLMMLV